MRILHLNLFRKWFDQIASGEKTEEYRKPNGVASYWHTRLSQREYDEVHFMNGYRRDSRFMRVECLGIRFDKLQNRYVISLGKVLEITTWDAWKK